MRVDALAVTPFRKPATRGPSARRSVGSRLVQAIAAAIIAACVSHTTAARAETAPPGLDYNAWCFNVLLNHGIRHGATGDYHVRMAAYAMADARMRMAAIARAAGMSQPDLNALDRDYFRSTEAEAASLAAGTAGDALVARYDGCRSRGIHGVRVEARLSGFMSEYDEKLWCQATMAHFTSRQMIGGGPERAARGATAARVLVEIIDHAFQWAATAMEDRDLLVSGAYFRALVQVEAFGIGGGKEKMERDYEPCFAMADLPYPQMRFDFPPAAEVRPARTPEAWDYPLSFEFRHAIWCREVVRLIETDPLIARAYTLNDLGRTEVADYADGLLAAEAAALGMSEANLDAATADTRRQVTYEFKKYDATGSYDELAYDFGSCTYLGAEERMAALGEMLFATEDESTRLDEALWCLAALEAMINGGSTDVRLRPGFDHYANIAVDLAPGMGLSRDDLISRMGVYQQEVPGQMATRLAPAGSTGLMRDHCISTLPH